MTTNTRNPEMVSLQEAARRTGLSYYALRKMAIEGRIPSFQLRPNSKRLINYGVLCEILEHGTSSENMA